jgi:hypothetical protein
MYLVSAYIPILMSQKVDHLVLYEKLTRSPFVSHLLALGMKNAASKLTTLEKERNGPRDIFHNYHYWSFYLSSDLYKKVDAWAAKHKLHRSRAYAHLISIGLRHCGLKTLGEKYDEKWNIQWRKTLGDKLFQSTARMAKKRGMRHQAVIDELWREAMHECDPKLVKALLESSMNEGKRAS